MGVELVKWNFPQVLSFFSRENTADSTSDKEHENATELAAEALADVIFQWKNWVYRRVDSVHPSEGARGRLRHSMDCEPPPDPRLAYNEVERRYNDINDVKGQLMVPLAFIEKGPMRHLDVWRNDGTSIPVLGSEETGELMVAVLMLFLKKNGIERTSELEDAMRALVTSREKGNLAKATNLIESGMWEGKTLWDSNDPAVRFDVGTKDLLLNLSTDFLLIGLLPAETSGIRQVLKFSYHWVVELPDRGLLRSLWGSVCVAFRAAPMEIELPTHMPTDAKSYHLEFHTPPELDTQGLSIPVDSKNKGHRVGYPTDSSRTPIAHVHSHFSEIMTTNAKVKLEVPKRGIWVTALLSNALTAGIFILALLLPNATDALRSVGGNAAALMLAAPAVFVSFLIFPKEHIFVSSMLNPLRIVVGICALLLFMMAGSLVGGLERPFLILLWSFGAGFSLLVVSALVLGPLLGEFFERLHLRPSTKN